MKWHERLNKKITFMFMMLLSIILAVSFTVPVFAETEIKWDGSGNYNSCALQSAKGGFSVHGTPQDLVGYRFHVFSINAANEGKKVGHGINVYLETIQYTSDAFRKELKQHGIAQSLSGTGHCFDNVRMESFFETLKKEKLYRIPTYKMTRNEVKTVIFRYVFVYYNTVRIYTGKRFGLPSVKYREWLKRTADTPAA